MEVCRILVVQSDWRQFAETRRLLTSNRFTLEWIADPERAVEVACKNRHQVLVVDIKLGDVDGLSFMKDVRDRGCTVPVIVLGSEQDRPMALKAIKLGAADFLLKGELSASAIEKSIQFTLERQRAERANNDTVEKLVYRAQYDELTGLPNRAQCLDQAERALLRTRRSRATLAVLFLDLDGFKEVNDTLGHEVGDQLLKDVAKRLRDSLREIDTVARWGGDEFTVILEDVPNREGAAIVAQKIVDVMAWPFTLGEHEVFVTTSVGVALYPESGRDAETLIKNADVAMYRAKQGGKNAFRFHEMTMNADVGERIALETSLRRAVKCQEFMPFYQPQIDLISNEVAGVEALLRWQDPDWGLVPAAEFMPLLEKTGLIVPVGEWVLRAACAQGKMWMEQSLPTQRIAVNLSLRQFRSQNLGQTLSRILDETGMVPQALNLEVTERILMDTENCGEALVAAKAMGVQITIDDFGTGYTCLKQLKNLPIDAVKIDKSFIRVLETSPNDAAVVTAIIAMAHSLSLRVVAEGVETQRQLDFLKAHDCDEIQGYLIARPMSAEAFPAWYTERRAGRAALVGP